MKSIAYVVRKYRSVRVTLVVVLSLGMAVLVGSGVHNTTLFLPGSNLAVSAPASAASKNVNQSQTASNAGTLDKALRTLSQTAAERGPSEDTASKGSASTNGSPTKLESGQIKSGTNSLKNESSAIGK